MKAADQVSALGRYPLFRADHLTVADTLSRPKVVFGGPAVKIYQPDFRRPARDERELPRTAEPGDCGRVAPEYQRHLRLRQKGD